MKARDLFASLRKLIVIGLAVAALLAQAQKGVRRIEIQSAWGGLGTPQNAKVVIQLEKGSFVRNGKKLPPELIDALVSALDGARIPEPAIDNLGLNQGLAERQSHLRRSPYARGFHACISQPEDTF